jgi:hypothetical protein
MFLEAAECFYRKFGFEKVSEARHDLRKWGGEGWYTHVFMVRKPVVARTGGYQIEEIRNSFRQIGLVLMLVSYVSQ